MFPSREPRQIVLPALLAAVVVLLPFPAAAQTELPNYITVGIVSVHPSMAAEWEAMQKERVAEYKKQGYKGTRHVYQTVQGNNAEYRVVTPLDKYADLDNANPFGSDSWRASWIARTQKYLRSREVLIVEVMKNLSLPADQPPSLSLLITNHVAPGKSSEYDEFIEKEFVPARKKHGLVGPVTYRVRFGERSRRLRILSFPIDNFGQFDTSSKFVQKGGDEARAILSKFGPLVTDSTWIIIRHRPELSYQGQ